MAIKAFKRPQSDTPDVNSLSLAIAEFTNQLVLDASIGAQILQRIALSTTPVQIPHKLGRRPIGWSLTRQNAGVVVYESGSDPLSTQYLTLVATGNCIVDLRVF